MSYGTFRIQLIGILNTCLVQSSNPYYSCITYDLIGKGP